MREILIRLFSSPMVEEGMGWLSIWHFGYLAMIIAVTVLLAVALRTATDKTKEKTLRFCAYAVPILYIVDFFIMPLSSPAHNIEVMKLPFHICTALAVIVPLAQFNHHVAKLRGMIAAITFVCATAYLIYPGTALEYYSPTSYLVMQTMFYHGAMLCWSVLTLSKGAVALQFRDLWKAAVFVVAAQLWATFGNTVYSHGTIRYDWFMMTGQSFPLVPKWLVPFAVFGVVFGGTVIVYVFVNLVKRRK